MLLPDFINASHGISEIDETRIRTGKGKSRDRLSDLEKERLGIGERTESGTDAEVAGAGGREGRERGRH